MDLDPIPGVGWEQIIRVALVARDALADMGLTGWPKTSGSRGMHIYCRIEPRWTFTEVRSAAVALAREIERRAPGEATSRWWKEERHGVFVDYNQNAKDRTVASAYSVRPARCAGVGAAALGRGARLPGRGLHHGHHARPVRGRRRSVGRDGGRGGLAGSAAGTGRAGRGRGAAGCAVAAALREAGGRAAPGTALQAQAGRAEQGGRGERAGRGGRPGRTRRPRRARPAGRTGRAARPCRRPRRARPAGRPGGASPPCR